MILSQADIQTIQRLLEHGKDHISDARFSPFVSEHLFDSRQDLIILLNNKAEFMIVWNGEFGCGSSPYQYNRLYFFKKGWAEPVPAGLWMDWTEEEWGISDADYEKLPIEKRLYLELSEQASKWVAKEYYESWIRFYAPNISDRVWWDEQGAQISIDGTPRQKGELANKYYEYALETRQSILSNPCQEIKKRGTNYVQVFKSN